MGSSSSAYPLGTVEQFSSAGSPSITSDGTNALMRGRSPTPTGLGIERISLPSTHKRMPLHSEILQAAARNPGEPVDPFTFSQTFHQFLLDRNVIGSVRKNSQQQNYIRKYKSSFVHAKRVPIKRAASRFGLPAYLLAGTIYNGVGGSELIKPLASRTRHLFEGSEAMALTSTGIGAASLQPRKAMAALGYDPELVDTTIAFEVIQSMLHDPVFSIFVCAAYLGRLRDRHFPGEGADDLGAVEVAELEARYRHGSGAPDPEIGSELRKGCQIVGLKETLAKLLTEAPVPDFD